MVQGGKSPPTEEKDDLVAQTDIFLADYFATLFGDPQLGVNLDFFMVTSPDATSVEGGNTITVNFTGVGNFDQGVIPTVQELNVLTKQAFSTSESLNDYLYQLDKQLPESNVFASTSSVTFIAHGSAIAASPPSLTDMPDSTNDSPSNHSNVALMSIMTVFFYCCSIRWGHCVQKKVEKAQE